MIKIPLLSGNQKNHKCNAIHKKSCWVTTGDQAATDESF